MNTLTPGKTPFYRSEHHEAIWRNFGSENIIISFSPRKEPAPAEFFGQSFFEKEKLSYVIVRTMNNTWYLERDTDDLLNAVREKIFESGAKVVTLFGSSMGSFGCIRAVNSLSPDKLILCAPVVTLDPAVESRWLSDYNLLMPAYERLASGLIPFARAVEVFAIYDPLDKDAQHVDLLEQSTPLTRIEIRGAGHMVLQYLRDSGTLGAVIRTLLGRSVKTDDVKALLSRSRKQNKSHLLNLIEKLDRKPSRQNVVVEYALKRFVDDTDFLLARASYQARLGQLTEARQMIEGLVSKLGHRCLGLSLGKAVTAYAKYGGKAEDIKGAVDLFRSTLPRPRGVQIWYSRFLRLCGQWDEAFKSHELFMGGDAFQAHAHIERGLILESRGLAYAAKLEFEKAVKFAPEFSQGRHHLARIQTKLTKKIQQPS